MLRYPQNKSDKHISKCLKVLCNIWSSFHDSSEIYIHIQWTPDQHWFEQCRSTYTRIFLTKYVLQWYKMWLVESENVEPGKWAPNVKLFRDFSTTGKVSTSNHHIDQGHLYLSFVYSINIFFKTSMWQWIPLSGMDPGKSVTHLSPNF